MYLKTFICHFLVVTSLTLPILSRADEVLDKTPKFIITPFTGYRYDIFQWSIPDGTSSTDKKLSELTWKNHLSETGIKVENIPEENQLNFLGQFKYGHILNRSKNQDSDWNNIGEFSRSFSSVKGNTFDLSGAVGFSQNISPILITYYMGIDYSKYRMKNYGLYYSINRFHDQNINNIDELGLTHPRSQLVASYKFSNYAPWLGASINYSFNEEFSIIPTVKLYLFYLYGQADWVLRNDLKHNPSFTHKALGIGASFDTELLYRYNNKLDFRMNIGIKKFNMTQGREKIFFADNTNYSRDLKKLSLFSSCISAGIRYKF